MIGGVVALSGQALLASFIQQLNFSVRACERIQERRLLFSRSTWKETVSFWNKEEPSRCPRVAKVETYEILERRMPQSGPSQHEG